MEVDDELWIVKTYQIEEEVLKTSSNQQLQQHHNLKEHKQNWKNGPASFWYSQTNKEEFEYGFKKKKPLDSSNLNTKTNDDSINDNDNQDTFSLTVGLNELNIASESYLLVNTLNWDDKVIYDSNNIRDKIDLSNERIKFAGWIPSTEHRTLSSFQSKVLGKNVEYLTKKEEGNSSIQSFFLNLSKIYQKKNF